MSEINDIEKIPEDIFPINLKLIQLYQRSEPRLMTKYKNGTYNNVFEVLMAILNL